MINLPWYARLKLRLVAKWQRRHFWFAHYPDCRFFSHLIIRVYDWRICLGCFLFWSGFATTAVAVVAMRHWWMEPLFFPLLFVSMAGVVALSILDIFVELPALTHRTIRFLGGGGFSLFFTWVALPPPSWLKIVLLLLALYGYRFVSNLRRSQMEDPCYSCPYYQPGRICPGFADRVEVERSYIAMANDYLQKWLELSAAREHE